jgi:hypothetical protein
MAIDMNQYQIGAFWSKVNITKSTKDCWEWQGAKKPKGYGNVRINKKYHSSHRVAFELSNSSIPKGFIVCHICDNPPCCNPSHLMLGTIKSNSADMLIKNRQKTKYSAARGEINGNSKLTEEDVITIRGRYASNQANQYQLAEEYGVTQSAIGSIVRKKTWRHVA